MTSIEPPYYNDLADLIRKSDIDSDIKNKVVEYIVGGRTYNEDAEKLKEYKEYNSIIKEIVDKILYKLEKESSVLLGKINRMEELNGEERAKFSFLIKILFLWNIATQWYYDIPPQPQV